MRTSEHPVEHLLYSHLLLTVQNMPRLWVKEYFKHHLIESCEAYLQSNNKKGSSARTDLITTVTESIRDAAGEADDAGNLPADLSKVESFIHACTRC